MDDLKTCRACGNFPKALGIGPSKPRLMVIGQSPSPIGSAITGIPFTSPLSGELLNQCLAVANISRDDVYITNVVKCSVPVPRDGLKRCIKWFKAELREVAPHTIVALGSLAKDGLQLCKAELRSEQKVYFFPHPGYAIRRNMEEDYVKMWRRLRV